MYFFKHCLFLSLFISLLILVVFEFGFSGVLFCFVLRKGLKYVTQANDPAVTLFSFRWPLALTTESYSNGFLNRLVLLLGFLFSSFSGSLSSLLDEHYLTF